MNRLLFALISAVLCSSTPAADSAAPRKLPRPDHVVIVIEENKSYSRIVGNMAAQYINGLANRGASFSQSYAVAHPSQPNYLALFSGSTQSIGDNSCPHTFGGENLASALRGAGLTFAIYSESMPAAGYTRCVYGYYYRKHNPAANWQGGNVPATANLPFSVFPADFSALPTVAIVVPNQQNDMHDGPDLEAIIAGDAWLKNNLDAYVRWAHTRNSLLIVTFDEDDDTEGNRIATLFVGPMVRKGVYAQRIDHYSVLRAVIDLYALPALGNSAQAAAIDYIWTRTPPANAARK